MEAIKMADCETFVAGLILSSTEGREPMTYDEARYTMMQWDIEGIEDIPETLTPELLADLWNYGIRRTMTEAEFLADISRHGPEFRYMLLDRMRSDCDYYLNYETQCHPIYNHLWAHHDPAAQIAYMKYLWNSFPDDGKPEWLTMDQINDYERRMIPERSAE